MDALDATRKPRRNGRPQPFERIVLLLQGGGALGAYQGGVYQALADAGLHPDWVAGISIGAVNAALIAGNPPERRVERLRDFWEGVTEPFPLPPPGPDLLHGFVNQARAWFTLFLGAPHFFVPRWPSPIALPPRHLQELSFYDTAPLRATLERLVDFDRINARQMRFSVGAANVRTGELTYFDNESQRIGPAHVMASGSLPPGLPATEIDGEFYWDGGVVSNTPLLRVLEEAPRQDTLAFQIDLWSASGELPRDFAQVDAREKDIRFSSRTKVVTEAYQNAQNLRMAVARFLETLPDEWRKTAQARRLAQQVDEKVCTIVHQTYHSQNYEGVSKDIEFSRQTMEQHWRAGFEDTRRSLANREVMEIPAQRDGLRIFDLDRRETAGVSD